MALVLTAGGCADPAEEDGTPVTPRAAAPATAPPTTERIDGVDRYATAVAASQRRFAGGSSAVVLASGTDFPDALVGAAVARAFGAPLLLLPPAGLTPVVRAEVERLRAGSVVLVGGERAVPLGVQTTLQDAGLDVRRVAGPDRYATAEDVATQLVQPGAPGGEVYLATGEDFPDALAAASTGRPVLLVTRRTLPSATREALEQLRPESVVVVGGPDAVSGTVLDALDTLVPDAEVLRIAGEDRYATTAQVHLRAASGAPPAEVALTTGGDFPDALSAAGLGVPVLLVRPDCVPVSTAAVLDSWAPTSVVALGGPAAVADGAAAGRTCGGQW